MQFLELEGGYLVIGLFVLIVSIIVTTRSFMPKNSFKKGVPVVFGFLSIMILGHYFVTIDRMEDVKTAFKDGKNIICESKQIRKVAQSLVVSKELRWQLDGDVFVSNEYERVFHSARCVAE
jgi:hypothetical protein